MALPLLAVRRIRTETGAVVLPGNPIPGSGDWSAAVKKLRIKQGFAVEQKAKEAKPKKSGGKAVKAKAKPDAKE